MRLYRLLLSLAILISPVIARGQISGVGQFGCNGTPVTGTGWTSATANNSVQALVTNSSVAAILVQLNQTSTITGGAITFQYNGDGSTFITIPAAQVLNPDTGLPLTNPYTLVASTNQQFLILLNGKTNAQLKLTSAITGTATVTPFTTALCVLPSWPSGFTQAISAASLPLPTGAALDASLTTIDTDLKANIVLKAGANIIGKVGIDQTTAGTTNGVTITDGTHLMPTGDASARSIHITVDNASLAITAASLPLPSGAAADATLTGGTAKFIPEPSTTSGDALSTCNILSAASTNATNCKASAGNFYGYEVFNNTTTIYYLRLYNLTTSPTCSSATGFIRTIPIPPAGAAGQAGGAVSNQFLPVNFGTGIGYCITGGSSSTDNTSAATGVFGEIRYK